ncbi:MAG TPA: peptidoglycan-binding protein, partial [Aequorivita sp.]|nr:peptidoglycan-binding protein [Aequorivita sp.]
MIKSKYQSVLDLGEKLNIQNGDVKEENGQLKLWGTAKNQYEKNLLWDEIKR